MPGTSEVLILVIGGLLALFDFGKWTIPLAAWVAPVCFLHFTRAASPPAGFLSVWLAFLLALSAANRGVIPLRGAGFLSVAAGLAATRALPFLVDRLLTSGVPGAPGTLVFPVAFVAAEYLALRPNPFGTWGALAYTQHGNRPLMQLASVTGIWGIAFLICWGASVAGWAWDHHFDPVTVQTGVLAYLAVWATLMTAGAARIVLAREAPTVRIAGIGWPEGIIAPHEMLRVLSPDVTPEERRQLRGQFDALQRAFFERSRREADAGSRVIAWPVADSPYGRIASPPATTWTFRG